MNKKTKKAEVEEPIVSEEGKAETVENQEEKQEEVEQEIDFQDKYLRLYAEFDNFRKRTMRERADLITSASSGVMNHMIPLIDDFDRAEANPTDDVEAMNIIFRLIEDQKIILGGSSGINIAGAIRMGKELGPGKTIVTILCDRSDKYSTKMFNKKFLEEKGLPFPNWL